MKDTVYGITLAANIIAAAIGLTLWLGSWSMIFNDLLHTVNPRDFQTIQKMLALANYAKSVCDFGEICLAVAGVSAIINLCEYVRRCYAYSGSLFKSSMKPPHPRS